MILCICLLIDCSSPHCAKMISDMSIDKLTGKLNTSSCPSQHAAGRAFVTLVSDSTCVRSEKLPKEQFQNSSSFCPKLLSCWVLFGVSSSAKKRIFLSTYFPKRLVVGSMP